MHEFIDFDPPIIIKKNFIGKILFSCKICETCNLTIIKRYEYGYNYYFINDKMVFNDATKDFEKRFSCDEIIIKNIIE